MRYARMSLLSVGAVIAYCLIAALTHCEVTREDTPKIILLIIFVFLWCMATDLKSKYFS